MILRISITTAFAMAALAGCSAGGGCDHLVNDIVERSEEGPYPDALKNDLRQLRDAALVFLQRGSKAECASIAHGMEDLLDDVTERMEAERERAARRAYLESARPVVSIGGIIKAEEVMDAPVHNLQDQKLGVIQNVALDPNTGQIAYVTLATGGFLGLGEKLIAIPWQDLRRTPDGELYVLDISREALERMKGIEAKDQPPADKPHAVRPQDSSNGTVSPHS